MRDNKPALRSLAWMGTGVLAVVTLYVAVVGGLADALALLIFLSIALVLIFTERLPPLVTVVFVGAALLAGVGWALGLFEEVAVYDELTHFAMSFAVALAIGYLVEPVLREDLRAHDALFVLVVTCLSLAVGVAWEWFELVVGTIGTVGDSLGDLLVDAIGAFVGAVVFRWALAPAASRAASARETGRQ